MVTAFEETDGDFVETINVFRQTVVEQEENVVFLNQLDNDANPNIHKLTTNPEVWEDTDGQIDIFVAAIGTGGTISGADAYLKSKNKAIQIIGIGPAVNSIAAVDNPDIIEITTASPMLTRLARYRMFI
ncbi:pyridoxal-phosphate dependent enzyme [Lysinibacillus sp. Ag94]|uniref:pyridoxal-phosphate dependent enzyme n=1 Tax=Lysinibacillus sp. Ag94 TaxID=2936682 RepID=UPI0021113BF8|nr:pyridoxal-phosphate dependent enzyme [Lysinibacillus sp. Ag94]